MNSIPHLGFIVAAYGVTAIVLAGMVASVILDGRAQRRLLVRLESRVSPQEAVRRRNAERS